MADIVTDLRRKLEQHSKNDPMLLHPSYVEDAITEIEHLRAVVSSLKATNAKVAAIMQEPLSTPEIAWFKEGATKEEMIDFLAGRKR